MMKHKPQGTNIPDCYTEKKSGTRQRDDSTKDQESQSPIKTEQEEAVALYNLCKAVQTKA